MRIVSDNIKNALKQPTTQRKGRILVNGNYYEVYNVEYYADSYEDGNVIGNAIASQLDFDLPYMEKFNTFKYFDGVWTGNEYEYVDMGTFTVFDEQDEDEFNKHITAFDNLIKFNAPFEEIGTYPKTLYQELQDICQQAGVELVNSSIPNGSFILENNQFVNGETLKTVLKAICQISGNYGIIKEDKLVLQLTNDTDETIIKNQHEPVIWKRKTYGINQVILQLGDVEGEYVIRQDEEDIAENGVHKLVITNNPFAYTQDKRDALIDELFNQVHGFGYIPYEMNYEWLNYIEIGDKITIDGIETLVLRIQGKSPKSLESFMSAPAVIDSAVEYVDNTNSIKNQISRTEIIVDKQNHSIEFFNEQINEQNQKVARVVQTVDELNSKISDVADITISNESIHGFVDLDNINESEPIRVVIRPYGENISYLYPSNNLYPLDNLLIKNRILRFYNKTTEEISDYILPNDLLYFDSENYDEFILDYDAQSCLINKKVGFNADGTTYILPNPTTKEYEYPKILLNNGDYKVSLLGYENVYLFVRLMVQNIYTTQFATKAEVTSEIQQTAQEINIEVAKKVNEDEVVSAINLSPEKITLDSNRLEINSTYFKLDEEGRIESTSGKIGGYNLESDNFNTEIKTELGFDLNTQEEFNAIGTKINNYISSNGTLTNEELELYDINDDGMVDRNDLLRIQRIFYGYEKLNGTFKIDSKDGTKTLVFTSDDGEVTGYLGLNGFKTNNFTTDFITVTNSMIAENVTINGNFTNNSDSRLKHDINELDDSYINIVKELKPVSFIYNQNNTKHIGFIAQDMENVFKNNNIEAIPVKVDEIGMYSINYINLIGILWKDNQYLHKEIEKLKEMIK